jgi:hypothetical protein
LFEILTETVRKHLTNNYATCVSYIKKNIKRNEQILWRPNNSQLVDRKVIEAIASIEK